jgi:hypothetical protein
MKAGLIILSQQANNIDEYLFGVISYNTLFTVVTTIFVFFLGVFFQKRLERYKRRINLKSIKENFLYLVKVLPPKYITPHKEQLRNFYLNSNIDTGIGIIPPITISGDLKRLSEFKSNDLFTSFRTLTNSDFEKDLHNILSQIDYLIEQTNIIDKYHNAILKRNDELRNEIQNLIEEYLDLIANSIRDIKKIDEKYEQNLFWVYINKMLIDYYGDPNRNNTISYLYRNLLRPMQVELVNKGYDREIKEAEQITLLGKKITTRRFYLRHQTVSIKLQYRQFYNETSRLLIDFNKISDKLTSLK